MNSQIITKPEYTFVPDCHECKYNCLTFQTQLSFNTSAMRILLIVFYACIVFLSCNNNAEVESRHEEIMNIHDELMPLMKEIYRLKKDLRSSDIIQDSIVLSRIRNLEEAEEEMMDWMSAYAKPARWNQESRDYLDGQLKAVQDMADRMKNSIQEADYLFQTLKR